MRDSFVFYGSFYDAIQELSDTDQLKVYDAVCKYALKGIEPEVEGISAAIFKLIKPQIDANNRRFENGKLGAEFGKLGGRPKKPQDNPKETPKKPQENPTQTPNVNVNVNDNVNVNENVNVNVNDNENVNDKTNYLTIISMYNETCVSFPKVKSLSDARRKALRARLRTHQLSDFQRMFEKAEQSDFLKGANGRDWSATFDWMIKDSNMAKILEGNYDNRASSGDRYSFL